MLSPPAFNLSQHQGNESVLRIRWPKHWSFSFNISPSNEHPELISFRMDWFDLTLQGSSAQSIPFRLLSLPPTHTPTPKLQYFGHLMRRVDALEKTLMLGKIESRRGKGKQIEMLGWHHQLNGHESEQAPGDGEGQGSLACCSPWGRKGSDTTEQLN